MFVDKFEEICAERGIAPSKVLDEISVSRSSYSRWKNKGYQPSNAVKKLIADYFSLTVKELMTGQNEKIPVVLSDNGQREINEIFSSLSPENRSKLLELARLYLTSQHKSGESK